MFMKILFLQSELMHAYIRAKNFKEIPTVYVNRQTMLYDYKELHTVIKYTKDYVGLGYGCTHIYYDTTDIEPIDPIILGSLQLEGLIAVDLTDINLMDI